MIKRLKMAVLPVVLLGSLFASAAFADPLGDRLANVVCMNLAIGQSYTLTAQEAQDWNTKLIHGTKSLFGVGQTTNGTFDKLANHDDALCTIMDVFPRYVTSCGRYPISKNGMNLTKATLQKCP